jgi:hypothetical protein
MHKVEKAVNHMHETVVSMLESKIESRIGKLEHKIDQVATVCPCLLCVFLLLSRFPPVSLFLLLKFYRDQHLEQMISVLGKHQTTPDEAPCAHPIQSPKQSRAPTRAGPSDGEQRLFRTSYEECRGIEKGSAVQLVGESLRRWPIFMQGPRSALSAIKFGLETQPTPLF